MKPLANITLLASVLVSFSAPAIQAAQPIPVPVPSPTPPVPVIVTKPVEINSAAPVRTTDAFPRTPIHIILCNSSFSGVCVSNYAVPEDKILVIESMLADLQCKVTDTTDVTVGFTVDEPTASNGLENYYYPIPLQLQGGDRAISLHYAGALNTKMVFASGRILSKRDPNCGNAFEHLFGYLLPSTAGLTP